jgi:predicted anti-sigma-YlaC factor YlaD
MKCRQVRLLLASLVDEVPEPEAAEHLASCARCTAELASYRSMVSSLSTLESSEIEPPAEYLERIILQVPAPRVSDRVRLLANARAVRYALASVGGVALGAGAIGLVWWRRAHRTLRRAAGDPEGAVSEAA